MEELPIIQVPCCYNCSSHAQQKDGGDYCWCYEIDVAVDWYCMKHMPDKEFEEEEKL